MSKLLFSTQLIFSVSFTDLKLSSYHVSFLHAHFVKKLLDIIAKKAGFA